MIRYYVIFTGQVQGVGFRWTVLSMARQEGLTGWIRNLDNGDVDMEIQGDDNKIQNLIHSLNTSSRWIQIEDYAMKDIPVKTQETRFSVIG